jgi:hypothetical protein
VDVRESVTSLVQILEQMHGAGLACEKVGPRRDGQTCSSIGEIAAALANSLETLRTVTAKNEWAMSRPVVHDLDWRLRIA